MAIIFVTGIDTGIGKSYATGLMARFLLCNGTSVITQKLVQTGCEGIAEDILTHRRLMATVTSEDDRSGATCRYVFPFPASPHLAAQIAGMTINPEDLDRDTAALAKRYSYVLVEGAGGLCAPLTKQITQIEYAARRHYPVVLVTSPRLGSISHTYAALDILRRLSCELKCLIYNLYHDARPEIVTDSRRLFMDRMANCGFRAPVIDIPPIGSVVPDIDFSCLL